MSNEIKEIIERFISQVTDKLGKRIKKNNTIWIICKRRL